MQDFKSLLIVVMIWFSLVNTHTHIYTDRRLLASYILLAETGELTTDE